MGTIGEYVPASLSPEQQLASGMVDKLLEKMKSLETQDQQTRQTVIEEARASAVLKYIPLEVKRRISEKSLRYDSQNSADDQALLKLDEILSQGTLQVAAPDSQKAVVTPEEAEQVSAG